MSPPSPRPAPEGCSPACRHNPQRTEARNAFSISVSLSVLSPVRCHSSPMPSIHAAGIRGARPRSRS
eukprot:3355967-Pyramimonas_sp.AAC.1